MEETATRDIPAPKWGIVNMTMDTKSGDNFTKQWLVKTENKHTVRVVHPVTDGKVVPPQFGQTDYVLVTQRYERLEERELVFAETTVYGSNEDGDFFNSPMYVTPGIREVWEAMFAIGEN